MKPSALALALGLAIAPQAAQGQGIAPSPAFVLFRPAPPPPPARPASLVRSAEPDANYALEGFAIGAIAGGVFVGSVGLVLCSDPDFGGNCAGPIVVGALVGGVAGGLVGGLVGVFIPKRD